MVLEAIDITFSLPGKQILHPVSASFSPGKVYGIVGHNGSGKSTFIKLLANQLTVCSGKVVIAGQNVTQIRHRNFARQVAYLPQELPSTAQVSVRELVKIGRYPWKGMLERYNDKDDEIIDAALHQANVWEFRHDNIDVLSGGERQRVWLAMCLAQQSPYLLLDEPLSSLDLHYQLEIMQLLHHLSQSTNRCIIIILHDINLVANYCDEVLAFRKGRKIVHLAADAVMRKEILSDIYQLDFSITTHPRTGKQVALP